jgi:hypothetical protein
LTFVEENGIDKCAESPLWNRHGTWYHVIARGIERRVIFRTKAYFQKFEALFAALPQRFDAREHTYLLAQVSQFLTKNEEVKDF